MEYIPRFLFDQLRDAIQDTPVIFINGPRQSGKSTLLKHVARELAGDVVFLTLDDLSNLENARRDSHGFVQRNADHIIIDEVQRVPELFLAIKREVDHAKKFGRFILTGSADIFLLPNISESLAGRIELLPMQPLSLGEIARKKDTFIDDLFDPNVWKILQKRSPLVGTGKEHLLEAIVRGGFPPVLSRPTVKRQQLWFNSYIKTMIERDIRNVADIEDSGKLNLLLRQLATRSACLLNFEELSRTAGIPTTTLKRYFRLLETVFLVRLLPPWSANLGKRLVKTPKIHFCDTGILCHLLAANKKRLEENPTIFGAALETFIVNEIQKIASWSEISVHLYHYRTSAGFEVDLVLESNDGRLVGIEIKATASPSIKDFQGLRDLKSSSKNQFLCGVLLHLGPQILRLEDNLYAIPVL